MENYFKNDFISINYNKDIRALVVQWLVTPTSVELREGSNMILPAMKHFNTGAVIWDTRLLGAISLADQHWVSTEYYSKALDAGYSCAAFIMPPDVFTQMSVEDIMSQVEGSFPASYFDDMEAAVLWVKSV